jgi:D-alanyl-D-alanine carboxypeptidase
MSKNYQKALFLVIIVIAAVLTRFFYVGISVAPSGAPITIGTPADVAPVPTSSQPSVLNSTDNVGSADSGAADSTTPYFGEASTTGSVFVRVATTAVPDFSQHASLVADLTNAVVLAQNNQDSRWPTASLTKLMTATLVLDHLSTSTEITITPQMFAVYPQEETLKVNGTYTVEDLLHVMLMPSSNVAAEAMADYYGRTQFIIEMNQRAAAWGMTNTYFEDPSGLSSANESTAHDLMILAQHIYNDYPQIFAITDTPQTTITNLATGKKYDVKSINDFAGEANFIGGKTGFTNEAEDNLLSLFSEGGHPVLVIVLGVADRFGDTTKLLDWFIMNYR